MVEPWQALSSPGARTENSDYCTFRPNNGKTKMISSSQSLPGSVGRPHGRLPALRHSATDVNPTSRAGTASSYSKYYNSPRVHSSASGVLPPPPGFLKRSSSEECIKCMMKIPHMKCEAHKYIRVGGGYRHSYWYVKAMMEELELQRQKEMLLKQRLDAIHEKGVRIIKTYIRTKSGKIRERIIYLSEEDYQKFKEGGMGAADILKKYLSKDDGNNLHSWDKDEQKAITTYVRTKSGRRIAKTVYVSKEDYEAMKRGDLDPNEILKQFLADGEGIEGWGEAEMKAVKTYVRTKSGRLVEKTVLVSKEDYDKLMEARAQGKGDEAMADILGKYVSMEDGDKIEGWEKKQAEPMKTVKAMVRTKSGRLVEKTILMTEEEYKAFQESGGDLNLLKKYMDLDADDVIEDWEKASTVYAGDSDDEGLAKAKDGQLIVDADGNTYQVIVDPVTGKKYKKRIDPNDQKVLKKMKEGQRFVGKDGNEYEVVIDPKTGKKVTRKVDPDEKDIAGGKAGERFIGKDGEEYEIEIDPKTGKKVKKKIDADDKLIQKGKVGERFVGKDGEEYEIEIDKKTGKKIKKKVDVDDSLIKGGKEGGRFVGKDGEEYEILVDPETGKKYKKKVSKQDDKAVDRGKEGQRFVGEDGEVYEIAVDPTTGKKYKKKIKVDDQEKKKLLQGGKDIIPRGKIGKGKIQGADPGDPNEKGMTKEEVAAYRQGKRRSDSDSDFSYRSVVSAGGTRHVKRRRKRADGTYSDEESYHSDKDEGGNARRKLRRATRKVAAVTKLKKAQKEGKRDAGSDSDFSYRSVVSAGGTRHVKRRKKRADGTYSDEESYHSSQDEGGKKRRKQRREKRQEAFRKGNRNPGSDSDFSYRSVVSAGGTRHVKRRKKRADGTYSDEESYHSSQDERGKARRRGRRDARQKAFKAGKRNQDSDSDFSYKSFVSDGGTRHVKRKHKHKDGTYSDSESYHSSQDGDGAARRRRRRRDRKHGGSANSYYSVVSAGGTRRVRRHKKRADGTYSDSESYHSEDSGFFNPNKLNRRKVRHEHGSDSAHSYYSEVSAGGTRRRKRRERIKDKDGKVIGYGKTENYSSPSEYETDSDYEMKPDGKGGFKKVKKKGRKGGPDGNMTDFSDDLQSTDSEDEPDLSKMTAEEKKTYLEEKAKRQAEREKKRKEKYGEKYEDMMEKHNKAKDAKKTAKSMVTYGKGSRFKDSEMDNRQMGLSHDEWGKKKKGKDGHDADSESEYSVDSQGRQKKKKKKGRDDDEESIYDYDRDADGNIILDKDGKPKMKKVGTMKKGAKKGKPGDKIDSDDEFEYRLDENGKVVRKKKGQDDDSDGDYFETLADGTVVLKKGKKKIDISKLSADDLKKLGIDLKNMSKEQIARILKEKFGDDIQIVKGGKKVGLKHADEFSGDNTDDMADNDDLDTSTLRGQKRVRVLMKKGGQAILEHLRKLVEESLLTDEQHVHPEEQEATVDFLQHYRLVDPTKIDSYARAFAVEDDEMKGAIYPRAARMGLEGVPSLQGFNPKQMEYVLKVLDIDQETNVTFRMFAVITALAERVTEMDNYCKNLLEISNIADIERKMGLYKEMFYCNVPGDRDPNYIKAESLKIELIAGGLNWDQQDYIMERMKPNEWREICFLDYLAYIPLFMSMHDNVCDNPLDFSTNKYSKKTRKASAQRDMNPLGFSIKKTSVFQERIRAKEEIQTEAKELLSGKTPDSDRNKKLLNKYQKLPHIIGSSSNQSPLPSVKKKY